MMKKWLGVRLARALQHAAAAGGSDCERPKTGQHPINYPLARTARNAMRQQALNDALRACLTMPEVRGRPSIRARRRRRRDALSRNYKSPQDFTLSRKKLT
jgi:hypothetical protein